MVIFIFIKKISNVFIIENAKKKNKKKVDNKIKKT